MIATLLQKIRDVMTTLRPDPAKRYYIRATLEVFEHGNPNAKARTSHEQGDLDYNGLLELQRLAKEVAKDGLDEMQHWGDLRVGGTANPDEPNVSA